jgi:2-methylaconitate cis-trans-isomerase PrpF
MTGMACSLLRGGSSKGVFFDARELPRDVLERDRLLVSLMGGADPRQVDGLGGGDPLTSKVALVSPATVPGADLDYESLEVGLGTGVVNRGIMCGNLASAVPLFAYAVGILNGPSPERALRIHCRSNGKFIVARRRDGRAWAANGAPGGTHAEVGLRFEAPAGAVTGRLLPLGEPMSLLDTAHGTVPVSVVDAGTLYTFVQAADLGCRGDEGPAALDQDQALRLRVESLRRASMERVNRQLGTDHAALRMKVAMVCPAQAGDTAGDLMVRILNPARTHKACAVSGAICLGAASSVPGSVVARCTTSANLQGALRIRHPAGVLEVTLHHEGGRLVACEVGRSARLLMHGVAWPAEDLTIPMGLAA